MSHVTWQFEETPRYENAPTTTPFRVSTAKHFFPITAGRIGANPQFRNRDDELRGNLSPMGDIVEMLSPEGSLAVGGYLHTAIPLLHAAGFVMTIVQGDGVNEVQTITASGSVTGGTYQLTIVPLVGMAGIVVSNIPWNATAAEVQRLIDARIRRRGSGFFLGDIVVGGGPLPTTPMTLTYQGTLCARDIQPAVLANSLTGSTPLYTLTTTTAGALGTILLPDGTGVPAGAYRATSAKRTGTQAKSAQIIPVYTEQAYFEKGQGFGVAQLSMDGSGNLSASLTGLVSIPADDPGDTPVYDTPAVHPLLSRDMLVTWNGQSGSISDFTWSISNPLEATRHYGIRSAYPGKLRYGTGFVTATGTVTMDEADPDDRDLLYEGTQFSAMSHHRTQSKIGSSGCPYQFFTQLHGAQHNGGSGIEDLAAKRRHGASFNWKAGHDQAAGADITFTAVSGLTQAGLETYV
jgi:hypothetical protein